MWVGVTLTVVVELVPNTIRSPAIAGYLFIISIIGGNMPLLVPPLKRITSLRTALYILFPGLYLLSSVLFLLTVFSLKRDMRRAQEEEEVIRPLLPETPTSEHPGKLVWQRFVSSCQACIYSALCCLCWCCSLLVQAWHEACAEGETAYEAVISRDTHFWASRKNLSETTEVLFSIFLQGRAHSFHAH